MISAIGVGRAVVVAAMVLLAAVAVQAAITMDTVTVGDPGNAGEWSGEGYGGYGPNRICGAAGYTFNMGKYEVTTGQYTAFLNAVAKTDTYLLYNTNMYSNALGCKIQRSGSLGSYTYSVAADRANRPVNYVSWGDAARFANWLNNGQPMGAQNASTTEDGSYYLNGATSSAALLAVVRKAFEDGGRYAIPTEDEWYKAAYYKGGGTNAGYWDYPTSSDTAPGRDMADVSGNNANYFGTPYPIETGKYTTVAGEFQNSDSPYLTFDQGGNILEWNEAVIESSRGTRGGSFFAGIDTLKAAGRYSYSPTTEDKTIGFRVSELTEPAVPEPATLSLLALGGLAVLRLRRR